MKRILSIALVQLFALGLVFGARIDSRKGYMELPWGSSVQDAQKAGYKLAAMASAADKEYLSKLYTEAVDAYKVTTKDKTVTALQFHYYNGKLFAVAETLNIKNLDSKKLEERYGKFSDQGIFQVGTQLMDAKFGADGKASFLSIVISNPRGSVSAMMSDWNVYKSISFAGRALAGTKEETIVDELGELAGRLIQEKSGGAKPSFAFVGFTTDYGNKLVENYVTDALAEAMFNTGRIKIIERENLEGILAEQKFQSSGLVNEETAKSIGMIAGVDFVCYGTLKDLDREFTVNARVVDVETGEIAAMSRTNITKDSYLENQVKAAVGSTSRSTATVATPKTTSTASTPVQTAPSVKGNAWKVTKYHDEFGGFTHYVFTINSTDHRMLFVSYTKCENAANNRVISGIHWTKKDERYGENNGGTYDIKAENGTAVTKKLPGHNLKCFLNTSETNFFYYAWNPNEGARWLVDMMVNSESVAVRRDGLTRRFQTAGLLDKMAEHGITWTEIDAAMAGEEF